MKSPIDQDTVNRLKDKLIQTILDSPEFRQLLQSTVNEITNYAKTASNEASVESCFDRELYALLKDFDVTYYKQGNRS